MTQELEIISRTGKVTPAAYVEIAKGFRRYAGIFSYVAEMCIAMASKCDELAQTVTEDKE